ncbi:MAG: hypothetical protein ACRC0L_08150, partial [Angustibacter sp.]
VTTEPVEPSAAARTISSGIFVGSRNRTTVSASVLGWVAQTVKISADTTLQNGAPDDLRGRIFACYDVTFSVSVIAGVLLVALTGPGSTWSGIAGAALSASYLLAASGCWLHHRRSSALASDVDWGPDSMRRDSR